MSSRNRRRLSFRPAAIAILAALEPRLVMAATEPTAYEQYMLELINRGRADPTAEAARYNVALNEGLAAGTISTAAKQPLTMDKFLVTAARGHTDWMLANNKFQHEGAGGSSPGQRMANAGYVFSGSQGTGENIAVTMSSSGSVNLTTEVAKNYRNLFVDENYAGRGHRVNLMNAAFESVGTGVSTGSFTYGGTTWPGTVLVNQDFAYSAGNPFLTGVAFNDTTTDDNFYTPGEGLGGVTVVAKSATNQTFTTTTGTAGGFSLQVPSGTYTITATNSNGKVATYANVVVGTANVKRDFEQAQFVASTPSAVGVELAGGTLTVSGTSVNDTVTVTLASGDLVVVRNGVTTTFDAATVGRVMVDVGDGADTVTLVGAVNRATVVGGNGNDSVQGGDGADRIEGGDGDDYLRAGSGEDTVYGGEGADYVNGNGGKNYLYGEGGNDRLSGGGGRDFLYGGAADDKLYGGAGNDLLDGQGNIDRLYGGDGDDVLLGGNSNDRMYGEAGNDTLTGGRGRDTFNGGLAGNDTAIDFDDEEDSILNIEVVA